MGLANQLMLHLLWIVAAHMLLNDFYPYWILCFWILWKKIGKRPLIELGLFV
jgi:hypothetical protein